MGDRPESTAVGQGRHVIFTHGWKNDRRVWSNVIAELEDEFTCVSWDLPAHGTADATPAGRDPHGFAVEQLGYLVEFSAHASGEAPVLVGHSLGGYLSLSFEILNPGRVQGIGLIATGPGYRRSEPREIWNQWVRDNADPERPEQANLCLQHDSHVLDGLVVIECPVHVITGANDVAYRASGRVFESKLARCTREEIADAGHMVHVKYAKKTADSLRKLLRGDSPEA